MTDTVPITATTIERKLSVADAATARLSGRETHEEVVEAMLDAGLEWEDAVAIADVHCDAVTA